MTRNASRKATSADTDERDESDDEATHEPPSHEGPTYPLLPDVAMGSIEYLVVHRVVETGDKPNTKPRSIAWPKRFSPLTTDEITIAEECGGGIYDVFGRNAKGHIVGGDRFEVLGEPKQPPGATSQAVPTQPQPAPSVPQQPQFTQQAPQQQDPIQQTASGMVAIRGADSGTNSVLAILQNQSQQVAEQRRADQDRWEKIEEQRRQDRQADRERAERDAELRREEQRAQETARAERERSEREAETRRLDAIRAENEARLREERDRAERQVERATKEANAHADMMIRLMEQVTKPPPAPPPPPPNDSGMIDRYERTIARLEDRLDAERRENRKDARRDEDRALAVATKPAADTTLSDIASKALETFAAIPELRTKLVEAMAPAMREVLTPIARDVVNVTLNAIANDQAAAQIAPTVAAVADAGFAMPLTNGAGAAS